MAQVVLTTVEAVHAPIVVEALDGAGIAARSVVVRAFQQTEYLRHQYRPMMDIEVDAAQLADAKAVLALMMREAEEAAILESQNVDPSPSPLAPHPLPTKRRVPPFQSLRLPSVAFVIGIFVPLASPLYARLYGLFVVSLIGHLCALAITWLNWRDYHLHIAQPDRPLEHLVKSTLFLFLIPRLIDILIVPERLRNANANEQWRDGD